MSDRGSPFFAPAVLLVVSVFAACSNSEVRLPWQPESRGTSEGRLTERPARPRDPEEGRGLRRLGLGGTRDGLLFVPETRAASKPMSLVVMLHGAGGSSRKGIDPFLRVAEDEDMVLLAPESRGRTWDAILGGFGPDVAFIDRALRYVFERFPIDGDRIFIEGFSDGASYALSLGLTNGDLFSGIVAFSPGFSSPGDQRGQPKVFISHGRSDPVLPIDATSREIVPRLRDDGYDVEYVEFDAGHTHPRFVVDRALRWMDRPRG